MKKQLGSKKSILVVGILLLSILVMSTSAMAASWLTLEPNFEGKTVHFVTWGGDRGFTDGPGLAHLQNIQEKYNVKIEFEHTGDRGMHLNFPQLVTSFVLEGEGNVVIMGQDQWMYMAAIQGLLLPIDDYLTEAYYQSLPQTLAAPFRNLSQFQGTTYAFPTGGPGAGLTEIAGIYWNKELFEEEGLPDLYELMERGEWTWDAFRTIALQATRDTSGDGEIDQWGVITRGTAVNNHNFTGFLYHWVRTNNGRLTRTVDGREVFTLGEPQAIEAMQFWQDLHLNRVIGARPEFVNGTVAMAYEIFGSLTHPTQWAGIDFEYGFVPLPRGPQATEHVAENRLAWVAMLPITVSDPEPLLFLWHELMEITAYQEPFVRHLAYKTVQEADETFWEQQMLRAWDLETIETMEWMAANVVPMGMFQVLEAIEGYGAALTAGLTGEKTPETAINEIAPLVQGYLDELFAR